MTQTVNVAELARPRRKVENRATEIGDNYRVHDLGLAHWGRKEIQMAEHEMPGLMALRAE